MVHILISMKNLQPFRHFTYATAHPPTLPSLYLRYGSFSNPSVASPTSQLILQPFHHFTYVIAHSPTLLSQSPTLQLILQLFRCITYVTAHSPSLLSLLLCHRLFTYVTWRAAHETNCSLTSLNYNRYHHHYHKRTAKYCNSVVRDILNIATFSHRYGALPYGWKS